MRAKLINVSLLWLFLGVFLFAFGGCAGSKGGGGSKAAPQTAMEAATAVSSSQLEDAKQAAEAAEWEAHRLREELHRKKATK
jgi:hypothetical protein